MLEAVDELDELEDSFDVDVLADSLAGLLPELLAPLDPLLPESFDAAGASEVLEAERLSLR